MAIAIAILAILVVAVVTLLLTANRRRATTGELSRETRERDASRRSDADEAEGRERADDTRAEIERGEATPAVRQPAGVARWEPVDEEEIGVSRRQFLNRAILGAVGLGLASFGGAALGFIWPIGGGGFGGKIRAGSIDELLGKIAETHAPVYVPEARAYVNPYPSSAVAAAEAAGYPSAAMPGLEAGLITLSQRCPHLGCRVPWCQTSQWFECPCHGSKYNRVGEKRDGPAPRGMTLWGVTTDGGVLTIDTGVEYPGMPIGTDTTEQKPEGPSCI
ncbi:MAG TPA: Rieske 2Fe-2S domain-containing protein [Acidimicrobiia bacterium]|nr:Rieske 2Fe-2S domain-containing protein [Acidimicrobiia bacterium]